MVQRYFRAGLCAGASVLVLLLISCSSEKLNELADKAKQAVNDGTSKVKETVSSATTTAQEQLNMSGSAQLMLDAPISTAACYVRMINLGGGRSNVMRVQSYVDAGKETFPSMMIQGHVSASTVSEMVGQAFQAEAFVQTQADGPVWFSPTGSQVEVKVTSMEAENVVLEIVGGKLRNTTTNVELDFRGSLQAVLQ